jgi:hypothetical protein
MLLRGAGKALINSPVELFLSHAEALCKTMQGPLALILKHKELDMIAQEDIKANG